MDKKSNRTTFPRDLGALLSLLGEPSFAEANALLFSNLLPNSGAFHGFDYMQESDPLGRRLYAVFLGTASQMPPSHLYRLLAALNVKYIQSFRPLPKGDISLVRHFPEFPSWLYSIDSPVPRSYIISRATVERDPSKTLRLLSSKDFDALNGVILEQPLSLQPKKDFKAQAKILRYENHKVTIGASLNGSGVLVLADSFYPGWRVYVDGKESKILRANFFSVRFPYHQENTG